MSEQSRRDLAVRQGELAALAQHPGYEVLRLAAEDRVEKIERIALAQLLHGEGAVDGGKVFYMRGYIHGLRWFAGEPGSAQSSLEQSLKQEA